jgi:hypothetical protein
MCSNSSFRRARRVGDAWEHVFVHALCVRSSPNLALAQYKV